MGKLRNLFKKEFPTLISQISILVTLLGVVFGLLFMIVQIYENRKGFRTSEVRIGVAPYHIRGASELEDEYVKYLISSNKYLRDHNLPYRFMPYLTEGESYTSVIKGLKEGKKQMVAVSMGLYGAIKHNKLRESCDRDYGVFNKDYELIGFLRKQNAKVYYSGIICRKNGEADTLLSLYFNSGNDSIFKQIQHKYNNYPITDSIYKKKTQDSISLLFIKDSYSTSSHIVPKNWLLDKGINTRDGNYQHGSLDRKDLYDSIKENNRMVGFISNEDFDRLLEQYKGIEAPYSFYKIKEMPIPYDAIIVNKKWWRRRGIDTRSQLFKALEHNDRFGITCLKEEEHNIDLFLQYIYGGVIYSNEKGILVEKSQGMISTISVPNRMMDIYNFHCFDSILVQLFKYQPNDNSNSQQFTPTKVVIDTATLIRYKEKFALTKFKNTGDTALPAGTRFIPVWSQ